MPILKLPLSDLVFDPRLQCRAVMDQEVIEEYADLFRNSKPSDWPFAEPMEAVEVKHGSGVTRYVTNGFTRGNAANAAGRKIVNVNVIKGTWETAVRKACIANAKQGQRRTNADKRRAVEIALAEMATLSLAQIAEACLVSRTFVSTVRKSRGEAPAQVSGSDGKTYPGSRPKNGSTVEPPAPVPEAPPSPMPAPQAAPVPAPKPKPPTDEDTPPLAFTGALEKVCKCGANNWVETRDGTLCTQCLEPYPDPKPIVTETLTTGLVTLAPVPEALIKKAHTACGRLIRAIDAIVDAGIPVSYFRGLLDDINDLIHGLPVAAAETGEAQTEGGTNEHGDD